VVVPLNPQADPAGKLSAPSRAKRERQAFAPRRHQRRPAFAHRRSAEPVGHDQAGAHLTAPLRKLGRDGEEEGVAEGAYSPPFPVDAIPIPDLTSQMTMSPRRPIAITSARRPLGRARPAGAHSSRPIIRPRFALRDGQRPSAGAENQIDGQELDTRLMFRSFLIQLTVRG
jgi:hypothetical protein